MRFQRNEKVFLLIALLCVSGALAYSVIASCFDQLPQNQASAGVSDEAAFAQSESLGKININLSDEAELATLPSIGTELSERIVLYRYRTGLFQNIEDIMNVEGMGIEKFNAIKDYITI